MGRGKRGVAVHDRITNSVFERMCGNGYTLVERNKCYNSSFGEGELDVLAIKKDHRGRKYAVIVEVKTKKQSSSLKKARSQLERGCRKVRELYGKRTRCFKMFVYRDRGRLNHRLDRPYVVEWVR